MPIGSIVATGNSTITKGKLITTKLSEWSLISEKIKL
jgi:hypothetical protein